jgi:hypothetical protein
LSTPSHFLTSLILLFLLPTKSARWVKRQRYQYHLRSSGRHSTLTDERVAALDAKGFVWHSHKATWEDRYQDLLAFLEEHGHTKVPTKYPKNPKLAVWVKWVASYHHLIVGLMIMICLWHFAHYPPRFDS